LANHCLGNGFNLALFENSSPYPNSLFGLGKHSDIFTAINYIP